MEAAYLEQALINGRLQSKVKDGAWQGRQARAIAAQQRAVSSC